MPAQRILELEQLLIAANGQVTQLTRINAELTESLSWAQGRAKKLKRAARRDERSFKEQLVVAQGNRV